MTGLYKSHQKMARPVQKMQRQFDSCYIVSDSTRDWNRSKQECRITARAEFFVVLFSRLLTVKQQLANMLVWFSNKSSDRLRCWHALYAGMALEPTAIEPIQNLFWIIVSNIDESSNDSLNNRVTHWRFYESFNGFDRGKQIDSINPRF